MAVAVRNSQVEKRTVCLVLDRQMDLFVHFTTEHSIEIRQEGGVLS